MRLLSFGIWLPSLIMALIASATVDFNNLDQWQPSYTMVVISVVVVLFLYFYKVWKNTQDAKGIAENHRGFAPEAEPDKYGLTYLDRFSDVNSIMVFLGIGALFLFTPTDWLRTSGIMCLIISAALFAWRKLR